MLIYRRFLNKLTDLSFHSRRHPLRDTIVNNINQHRGVRILSYANSATRNDPVDPSSEVLVDNFGRNHTYLRISLTEKCNLRCEYCMPAAGVTLSPRTSLLSVDELLRVVSLFVSVGVDKVRLTGGEPMVRPDLADVIASLKSVAGVRHIAMTTNGVLLWRRVATLCDAGLDAVNISLDTLAPHKFQVMTRRAGWHRVWHSVQAALHSPLRPVKLNVVVMCGVNDDELLDFAALAETYPLHVRFIEYMPFDGNEWRRGRMLPYGEMLRRIRQRWPQLQRLHNDASDTAKSYSAAGWCGQVGFISSMTDNFCSGCNRLRITADGALKVCLFGHTELSLRDAIRNGCSDGELLQLISSAVKRKKKQHAVVGASCRHAPVFHASGYFTARITCGQSRALLLATPLLNTGRPLTCRLLSNDSVSPTESLHSDSAGQLSREDSAAGSPQCQCQSVAGFTHVVAPGSGTATGGGICMVDISDKPLSARRAVASARVIMAASTLSLLRRDSDCRLVKGAGWHVLVTAQLAGVAAAKLTSQLIPLCHQVPLSRVHVTLTEEEPGGGAEAALAVRAEVGCVAGTGVEMEALTAAAVASLTVIDMCKAVDRRIRVDALQVEWKSGGRSGTFSRE